MASRYDRLNMLLQRVLIRTGARPGELCKLWWDDLVWAGGRTSAGHAFAKAVIPPERWKSGASTGRARTIYLSPVLTRALPIILDGLRARGLRPVRLDVLLGRPGYGAAC